MTRDADVRRGDAGPPPGRQVSLALAAGVSSRRCEGPAAPPASRRKCCPPPRRPGFLATKADDETYADQGLRREKLEETFLTSRTNRGNTSGLNCNGWQFNHFSEKGPAGTLGKGPAAQAPGGDRGCAAGGR